MVFVVIRAIIKKKYGNGFGSSKRKKYNKFEREYEN